MIAEEGQLQRQTPPPGLARKPEIEAVGVFGLQLAVADGLVCERKKGRELEAQAPTAADTRSAVAQLVADPRPRRPDIVETGTLVGPQPRCRRQSLGVVNQFSSDSQC